MRNIYNALTDTMVAFRDTLESRVIPDPMVRTRWRVQIIDREIPNSLLEVEVLNLEGDPVGCVLEQTNLPRTTVARFLRLFMESLDSSFRPPGGSPTA
jgi:hypothetical protein